MSGSALYEAMYDRFQNFRVQLPWDAALEFIRRIDRHNAFETSVVIEMLECIDRMIPRTAPTATHPRGQRTFRLYVGREPSPVIYLERFEYQRAQRLSLETIQYIAYQTGAWGRADHSTYKIEDFACSRARRIEFRFFWR